jgi:hypothetical protein
LLFFADATLKDAADGLSLAAIFLGLMILSVRPSPANASVYQRRDLTIR